MIGPILEGLLELFGEAAIEVLSHLLGKTLLEGLEWIRG